MLTAGEVFGDNMVLQRGTNVKIWGTGQPDCLVSVQIQNQKAMARVRPDGSWMAELGPLEASEYENLDILCGEEAIHFRNVAVGEVWIASGQSNMEYLMGFEFQCAAECAVCANQNIRQFDYPEVASEYQRKNWDWSNFGFWRPCDADNLKYFSAVAYYFAKELQQDLQVPIGILNCSAGGSRAACWMDEEHVKKHGAVWWQEYLDDCRSITDLTQYEENYNRGLTCNYSNPFENEFLRKMMGGLPFEELMTYMESQDPTEFVQQIGPCHMWRPSGIYHTMLEHVMPYTARGVIFYQGESDEPHYEIYADMMEGMIENWREKWDQPLPFLMVQLPPYGMGTNYPGIRMQQQLAAERIDDCWLASFGDCGSEYDIHPKGKEPFGKRLALLARGHVYGEEILCESPAAESCTKAENRIVISFCHAPGGLHICGDKVGALVVKDSKGQERTDFDVQIHDHVMEIIMEGDAGPLTIEFAMTPFHKVNLFNEAGLPVKPFRFLVSPE